MQWTQEKNQDDQDGAFEQEEQPDSLQVHQNFRLKKDQKKSSLQNN